MLTITQTLKSKTFWVNAVALITEISGVLPPAYGHYLTTVVPIITIILKVFFTSQVPQ